MLKSEWRSENKTSFLKIYSIRYWNFFTALYSPGYPPVTDTASHLRQLHQTTNANVPAQVSSTGYCCLKRNSRLYLVVCLFVCLHTHESQSTHTSKPTNSYDLNSYIRDRSRNQRDNKMSTTVKESASNVPFTLLDWIAGYRSRVVPAKRSSQFSSSASFLFYSTEL